MTHHGAHEFILALDALFYTPNSMIKTINRNTKLARRLHLNIYY